MILMAEIYFDMQECFKLFVPLEEKVVVGRHGVHLGESLFDAKKGAVDIQNRHTENPLNE